VRRAIPIAVAVIAGAPAAGASDAFGPLALLGANATAFLPWRRVGEPMLAA